MSDAVPQARAGWYPDTQDENQEQYWDGGRWTDARRTRMPPHEQAEPLSGAFWAGLGALLLIAIGSFGPWVDAGFVSRSGMKGDGVITVILALVGAAILIPSRGQRGLGLMLIAALVGAIAGYDIADISSNAQGNVGFVDPGWGLYATAAGAVVLLVSAYAMRRVS